VGIQSFNPEVGQLIQRRQNFDRLADNLRWLRERSGVHVHADLIAGLPGESLESFGAGFDRLLALRPQEIQVGLLKRLRGTPISRHDASWSMRYNPLPPYEILQNRLLDFATLGRLRRFAKFWDIFGNSGNFVDSLPLIWLPATGGTAELDAESDAESDASARVGSPFWQLLKWTDWLHQRGIKTSGVALTRQYQLLWDYLRGRHPADAVAMVLTRDYRRAGRKDIPPWLEVAVEAARVLPDPIRRTEGPALPKRQGRHLGVLP